MENVVGYRLSNGYKWDRFSCSYCLSAKDLVDMPFAILQNTEYDVIPLCFSCGEPLDVVLSEYGASLLR